MRDPAVKLALGIGLAAVVMAGALLAMGRLPFCACGYVKLWHGLVQSSENSQHLTDWYTFSHVLHGFLLYGALRFAVPTWPLSTRALAAVVVEAMWEVLENTNWVIERYREATISLDYFGDTVINSIGDLAAMLIGFAIAARAPLWLTAAFGLGLELMLAVAIRDGFTLNVLMLLWPIEAVRDWQTTGG